MTASVVISIVALIVVSVTCVSITVLVSKALSSAFSTLNAMHARSGKQMDSVLDRLVALDWEKLAALRSIDEPTEGGFYSPDEQLAPVEVQPPARWGSIQSMFTEDEEALLAEDFDESNIPRRVVN